MLNFFCSTMAGGLFYTAAVLFTVRFAAYSEILPQSSAIAFVLVQTAVNSAAIERDWVVCVKNKGAMLSNQPGMELIEFPFALFVLAASLLGIFSVVLPLWEQCCLISRLMVLLRRSNYLVISVMVW